MTGLRWFLRWSSPDAAYCLADWRRYLGEDFGKVEPHLEKVTGRITGSYPDAGGNIRYEVRLHGDGWLGVPMDGGEEGEEEDAWPRLTAEDVQLWRLNSDGREILLRECDQTMGDKAIEESARMPSCEAAKIKPDLMRHRLILEWRKEMVYLVGGRFWIKGDFSQVLTRGKRDDLWDVPPFTRMILKVLLVQCGQVGQTGEIIYERARAEYVKICPESAQRAHGMEMIPKPASLVQFFRRQRNGKKQTHPLYGEIQIVGQKPATYSVASLVLRNA